VGGASPAALETSLACGGLVKILDGGGPKFFENCHNIFFFKIFSRKFLGEFFPKKKLFPPGLKKQYRIFIGKTLSKVAAARA
jgi:hypothetical protein